MAKDGVRPLQGAVAVFELLADGTRLWLLFLLCDGEANVSAQRDRIGLSQPTVSHHLGILRRGGLVLHRREGKSIFYRLAEPPSGDGALRVSRDGVTVTITPPPAKGHH